jgi:excisionase family DNA binding protein
MPTTTDAAARLNMTPQSVARLCKQGQIRATKHGRDYLITEQELARFAALDRPGHRPRKDRTMKLDLDAYDVRAADSFLDQIAVGLVFYLTETMNTNNGDTWCEILARPGRTNMSHEERVNGFLGCTNNLSTDAQGQWRITRIDGAVITAERID